MNTHSFIVYCVLFIPWGVLTYAWKWRWMYAGVAERLRDRVRLAGRVEQQRLIGVNAMVVRLMRWKTISIALALGNLYLLLYIALRRC